LAPSWSKQKRECGGTEEKSSKRSTISPKKIKKIEKDKKDRKDHKKDRKDRKKLKKKLIMSWETFLCPIGLHF